MKGYWRFFRFRYHLNFVSVIAGALFVAGSLTAALAGRLALLYVCFVILLYGGLYAFNDVTDADSDRLHPKKRLRPIASGAIPAGAASVFAAAMTAAGLVAGRLVFGPAVFRLFLVFVGINVVYSAAARKVPFLDLAVNASTHPLRFVLGAAVAGGRAPVPFLAAYYLLFVGFACLRRVVEMDVEGWQSRRAIRRYSRRGLLAAQVAAFAAMTGLLAADRATPAAWKIGLVVVYAGAVFGIYLVGPMRRLYRASFTR